MKVSGRGWAYTGVGLGGLVSIAANVANSLVPPAGAAASWSPPAGAILAAVVWPVFLFVAIEILARTPWRAGFWWRMARFGGLVPVAAVAAFVSYRHLSGLLDWYGEDPLTVAFGPLAVDGLMVMATGALISSGQSARADTSHARPAAAAAAAALASSPAPATRRRRRPGGPARPKGAVREAVAAIVAERGPDVSAGEIAGELGASPRHVGRVLTQLREATA